MLVTDDFCQTILNAAIYKHGSYASARSTELLEKAKRLKVLNWKADLKEQEALLELNVDDAYWSKCV